MSQRYAGWIRRGKIRERPGREPSWGYRREVAQLPSQTSNPPLSFHPLPCPGRPEKDQNPVPSTSLPMGHAGSPGDTKESRECRKENRAGWVADWEWGPREGSGATPVIVRTRARGRSSLGRDGKVWEDWVLDLVRHLGASEGRYQGGQQSG